MNAALSTVRWWWQALRPVQWTKNLVVLAAFVFAAGDARQHLSLAQFPRALAAAFLFCLLSSAVYLMNDIRDVARDRLHPLKRNRPLASGHLSVTAAAWSAVALGALALGLGWRLAPGFFAVGVAYLVMQVFYSFGLKAVPLVDLFIIAGGFVLRAIAGGVVLGVLISPWLLLCTLLLALFLALCKRRHEKVVLDDVSAGTRPVLDGYTRHLLDQMIAIVSAATIVSYSVYTLWPETVQKFGGHYLVATIPFVIYGLFRYLDLVYRHEGGDRPERILLTDKPLLIDILLYGLLLAGIFVWTRLHP